MNLTLLYVLAFAMLGAGLGFIYFLLRPNDRWWPRDGLQWMGVSLSALLVAAAVFLLMLVARFDRMGLTPAEPGTSPYARAVGLDEPAKDFSFKLVADDAPRTLAGFQGDVVLLNFWATWCAPCLSELPDLNRLQETYREQGLTVLTISDEPRDDLIGFQDIVALQTVSGYVEGPEQLPVPFRNMLQARPMTFLIDRQGILRDAMVGARDYATFEAAVLPYLGAENIARR